MLAKKLIESAFEVEDPEDLAAEFIQDEVGQYDWQDNLHSLWKTLGSEGLRNAVALWMEETGRNGDAFKVIQELGRLLREYPLTRWQQMIRQRVPQPVPRRGQIVRRQIVAPSKLGPGEPV